MTLLPCPQPIELPSIRGTALWFSLAFLFTPCARAANFKVIYAFGSGGSYDAFLCYAPLLRDAKGNLYGTTVAGGTSGEGTIFELSPNSNGTWSESILYNFTGGSDGGGVMSGLVFDSSGNLYGVAQRGGSTIGNCGSAGCGVVFELSPSSTGWNYSVLHTFAWNDGSNPNGSLVLDLEGNLYGVTYAGGVNNGCVDGCGVVFELVRASDWQVKILHTFQNYPNDGADPAGPLVFDANGKLYGTTVEGGKVMGLIPAYGTVYELSPTPKGEWNEIILHTFCETTCSDGSTPTGGPVLLKGTLYGSTFGGGINKHGTIFELADRGGSWQVSNFSFDGSDGYGPNAPVLIEGGNLFGTTFAGGIENGTCYPDGNGVVFELSQSKGIVTETVLYSFTGGSDGCLPNAPLISDAQGNLYGSTTMGGSSLNGGVIFQVTP